MYCYLVSSLLINLNKRVLKDDAILHLHVKKKSKFYPHLLYCKIFPEEISWQNNIHSLISKHFVFSPRGKHCNNPSWG